MSVSVSRTIKSPVAERGASAEHRSACCAGDGKLRRVIDGADQGEEARLWLLFGGRQIGQRHQRGHRGPVALNDVALTSVAHGAQHIGEPALGLRDADRLESA